jgi:hypothetical protein
MNEKEMRGAAMTAAMHGEKTAVLELQHAMIGEEIKTREQIKQRNLNGIHADEAMIRDELQQVLPPDHENAADNANDRKERHLLERTETELHREERAEERSAWTDVQPLTREDRDIHKTTLEQEQRKKRIDELL